MCHFEMNARRGKKRLCGLRSLMKSCTNKQRYEDRSVGWLVILYLVKNVFFENACVVVYCSFDINFCYQLS